MTTVVSPTASQRAAAQVLLDDSGRWSRGRSKETGREFWLIRGSQGRFYFTTSYGCSCRGFAYRGCCSHVVAVTMREAQAAAQQAVGYVCRFRDCGEPTEERGALCTWHQAKRARLARELGV